VQVRKGKYPVSDSEKSYRLGQAATYKIDKNGENKSIIFRFNPGKQQVVFPPSHPYYSSKCSTCQRKNNVQLSQSNERCKVCILLRVINEEKKKKRDNNKQSYEYYLKNPEYINVDFNQESGGLMATHKDHLFDHLRGKYEIEVQNILFNHGDKIIFESEKGKDIDEKYFEGYINDKSFELASSEGVGKNNIKHCLQHCKSKNAEVAVIYFADNKMYNTERLLKGIYSFKRTDDYRFSYIMCVVKDKRIIYFK